MRNQVNDRPMLQNQAVKFVTVNLKQKEMPYLLKTVVIFYGNKQEKKKTGDKSNSSPLCKKKCHNLCSLLFGTFSRTS